MKIYRLVLVAATLSTAALSVAEDRHIWFGLGGFQPTNKKIKDLFGTTTKIDFDAGGVVPTANWKTGPDLNLIRGSKNGNKYTVIPFGIGSHRLLGNSSESKPYIKVSAGLTYVDYSLDQANSSGVTTHYSDKKIGTGASAEVGVYLTEKFRVTARYNLLSKVNGFDFSGLSASVQYAIAKF